MKKQVSVFGLHARAALNRLLPVVLGLLVVEGIFAGLCIAHGAALTLSGSNLESALHYSFRAGILALQVLLASCFGANSRYSYTLQRLRISERCVSAMRSCGVCRSWRLWARHSGTRIAPGIQQARRACLWISTAAASYTGFCRWRTDMYGRAI